MKKFSIGLVALVAAVFMAVPAMAATDFDLYGQLRFTTFYEVDDLDDTGSDTDLDWTLQTNARVGMQAKLGNTGFRWETGTSGGSANIRLLYGTWDFGQGTLLIGQNYAPYTWYSDQVWGDDNGFMGFGALHERRPMVQVKLKNGFHLTALTPDANGFDFGPAADDDVDTYMPKMVLGYDGAVDGFVYGAGIAYQRFDQEEATTGFDESIDAYLLYHHGKLDMQPLEIIYQIHYGQNLGTTGLNIFRRDAEGARLDGNGVEDTDSFGGFAQVGYTMTETSRLHTGVAYINAENDAIASGDDEERVSAFVNAEIFLTDNFFIVPEVSYINNLERFNGDEGDFWAFGAKWQMNF